MAIAFLALPAPGLRRAFHDDVRQALKCVSPARPVIGSAHLMRLPDPVRRYLHGVGVVGQPPVANFRVRLHGRIRSAADSRWMPVRAEQYTFVRERKRFFYLTSSMFGALERILSLHRVGAGRCRVQRSNASDVSRAVAGVKNFAPLDVCSVCQRAASFTGFAATI